MFRKVALTATVATLLLGLVFVAPAAADFGLVPGTLTAGTYQADGTTPETQAGAAPAFASSSFAFNTSTVEEGFGPQLLPDGNVKDIVADLPPGLLGDPLAVPECPRASINNTETFLPCPPATQVGTIELHNNEGVTESATLAPVYNMVPREGEIASFGFAVLSFGVVHIEAHLRSDSDYGVELRIPDISTYLPTLSSNLRLWGNPSDASHDSERDKYCFLLFGFCEEPPVPLKSGQTPIAFVRNPAVCSGTSPVTDFQFDSWQEPTATKAYSVESPPVTGCEKLGFRPSFSATPETARADSPTGLGVELKIPQQTSPQALATPPLRNVTVRLPRGLTVNTASANGLAACSTDGVGLIGTGFPEPNPIHFSDAPANCPDGAKIGTVEVTTPVLDHPLQGSVYLGQPEQNPFGSLLALYLVVEDPRTGIVVKLAGKVDANEATGQLTATFEDNPQLPFEELHLHFFGGSGAALSTPAACGTYEVESELASWASSTTVPVGSSFEVASGPNGAGCPTDQLQPKLTAGLENPVAGARSPLVLSLTRGDGTRRFAGLSVKLPTGLTASLKGVEYCPDQVLATIPTAIGSGAAQLANPSCPASSRIGSVAVGVGAGPDPYYANTGSAYLAGPYKGAPLSLAIVTPAVAGPFDLGNVVVRSALRVDPETTQITAESDPIPTILDGIPLDIRDIRVAIDRSDFTLAPTDCRPKTVEAVVAGEGGGTAAAAEGFQVGDCASLPFEPKLRLSLKGSTRRAGHPALKAVVTYPEGASANIARAQVSLPHSEFLDQGNLNKVCTQNELKSQSCPTKSIYGHAKAWTPLLDKPLEGPVYLAVGFGYKLPALVAELNGQIRILLKGKIDTDAQKGIRNTFEAVPDAPVSRFVLEMKGGPRYGLLENSENICEKAQQASARFTGQNGAVDVNRLKIAIDCPEGRRIR